MMWFKKFFLFGLLVCGLSVEVLAVDNFCGDVEDLPTTLSGNQILSLRVIEKTQNSPSILRSLAPLRVMGKLDTQKNPDLYYIHNYLDPDNEIRKINFGNTIQDERFRDYLIAKLLLKKYVESISESLDKTELIDSFIKNNTSFSFQSEVHDTHILFSNSIQEEFANNQDRHSLTLLKSFKEGLLKLGDIAQSTGKAGLDILIETTYLKKLKDLTKIKDLVYLLEEDYRDSGKDVAFLPIDFLQN